MFLINRKIRSSSLQMFFSIGVLKNFAKFHRKTPVKHRCFPVKFAIFLRTPFLRAPPVSTTRNTHTKNKVPDPYLGSYQKASL